MKKIIFLLVSLIPLFIQAQQITTDSPIFNDNKDVLVLSVLIRKYFQHTNREDFNQFELAQIDTLKRISNNFDKLDIKNNKGYISVYFKFSNSRNNLSITLKDDEKEPWLLNKLVEKEMNGDYNGEVQFYFGERFYHIRKIIVKKIS